MKERKEYKVIIPDEEFQIFEFYQDELPGVGVLNKSLLNFEQKEVFCWHCTIEINFAELVENGMPNQDDSLKAFEFEDFLDENIKGENKEIPNALFLSRVTWDGTRELIWRVFNPELVNEFLQKIINEENYLFEFDYRIEEDENWELAKWYLNVVK